MDDFGPYPSETMLNGEQMRFLAIYGQVHQYAEWLAADTTVVGTDPVLVGVRIEHQNQLFEQIGIDPASSDAFVQLETLRSNIPA